MKLANGVQAREIGAGIPLYIRQCLYVIHSEFFSSANLLREARSLSKKNYSPWSTRCSGHAFSSPAMFRWASDSDKDDSRLPLLYGANRIFWWPRIVSHLPGSCPRRGGAWGVGLPPLRRYESQDSQALCGHRPRRWTRPNSSAMLFLCSLFWTK